MHKSWEIGQLLIRLDQPVLLDLCRLRNIQPKG
jgi:hypothetical protein